MTDERTSDLVARPGGVMTDEVGAITGDLTLRTEVDRRRWSCTACSTRTPTSGTSSPVPAGRLAAGQDIDAVHKEAVAALSAP